MSPLHSRGSPTPSAGSKKLENGPHQRGTKSEVATLPVPFRTKRGWKCYVTPAFPGRPNTKHGEQGEGPKIGGNATSPLILGDPQRQVRGAQNEKWSPTKANKITSAYLTHGFLGTQKRAEMLHHPCILGDPLHQARQAKNEDRFPIKENNIRSGYLTPAF